MKSSILAQIFFLIFGLTSSAHAQTDLNINPDVKWLKSELQRMGLPKGFVADAMKDYHKDSFETVVRLNLLGFLKPPQHMDLVTPQAVTESSLFLKQNKKEFEQAHARYEVAPDVISALLWIETRHGDNLGQFHTVSVFLHVLQADRPANRKELTRVALQQNKSLKEYTNPELKKKMSERTKKKANWARDEIQALASIYKKGQLNIRTLKGSYAGAFGLAQFLPSSYRDYARSIDAKAHPNLMKPSDAIMSVAHYLSRHGWKKQKAQKKFRVLMTYNNSRDYADSILEISRRVNSIQPNSSKSRGISAVKDRS
ncbi:MAG: lytic murein transglycosylase [Pseudobdellovibrionaceae bacterium]